MYIMRLQQEKQQVCVQTFERQESAIRLAAL